MVPQIFSNFLTCRYRFSFSNPQKTGSIYFIQDLISKFAVRVGKVIQEGWVDLVGYM